MRKKIVFIYLIIFVLLFVLGGYFFLYNIYGIELRKTPQNLFADHTSEITIQAIPINAIGKKAIFRNSSATFLIVEGSELIEIIKKNPESGLLRIRSKGKVGLVGIKIKSEYSLVPEYLEIEILPLSA